MSSFPLDLILATDDRPGCFTLTCDSISYSIEFRPEMDVALGDLLRRLHPVLVGGTDPLQQLDSIALLQAVGMRLWQAIVPDAAPTNRDELVSKLRGDSSPLRLVLPQSLAALPWELLCDPHQPNDTGFLALRRPLVRLLPGDDELPPLAPPLRVLLLISLPLGLKEWRRVDVESERAAVENATREFRQQGLLHLLVEDIVTPKRVRQALLRFKPHILHYIGHGGYIESMGGFLEWEDEKGQPLPVADARIADLLRRRGLRAVLLHGCETASSDRHTDFTGVAGALIGAGIPAILAQQASFTYESSQLASEMFYTALTAELGLAEATFEARQALAQGDRPDWAVPVLQATAGGLTPLLDADAPPGEPDPRLARSDAAANLPAPTGVFVGRQRELRALRTMLESAPSSGPVLALITGPGGVGKSTLTAQAVVRYGGRYKSALTLGCRGYQVGESFELFLKKLGEFLKYQGTSAFLDTILPDPQRSIEAKVQQAVEALNNVGSFLLILDNLESVQLEDRTLADDHLLLLLHTLLTNLRSGRALITGRYAVEGLLPDNKFQANLLRLDLDDLSSYEIRQLLARHPSLAHLNTAVQDELVREFGGLPYVYDVLSSRAANQSLDALIRDIHGRITEERRQRSTTEWEEVRQEVVEFAALDATVARLPEQSRTLLGWLSVFRRSFPLEALEQGLKVTKLDWQPLIDWSLLRYDAMDGDYRLHSLTARYTERLLEAPDRVATQIQVAEWYMQHAGVSHDLNDWLEAHRLFSAAGAAQRAGELANSLTVPLSRFGLYEICRTLCTQTIRDAQGTVVAEAQRQLGMIAEHQGRYDEAEQRLMEALQVFGHLDDQHGRARTLHYLAVVAQHRGQYDQANRLLGEVLQICKQFDDQEMHAGTLHELGIIAQQQGKYDEARRLHGEALEIFRHLDDSFGHAGTLHELGMIAKVQRKYDRAKEFYSKSLEIMTRLGDQRGRANLLQNLGDIAQVQGQYEEAWRLYHEALNIYDRLDDLGGRANVFRQLGHMAEKQKQYKEARQFYSEALTIFDRQGKPDRITMLHALGSIARQQGEYEEARRFYNAELEVLRQLGDQGRYAGTLLQLGSLAREQEEYKEARQLLGEALDVFERLDDQHGRANTLHELGIIAEEQEEYEEARQLFSKSLAIQVQLGDQHGRAAALHQLGLIAEHRAEYQEARRLYGEAVVMFERLDDQHGRADTLYRLGIIAREQGEYEEAHRLFSEALDVFERLDEQHGQADLLHQLGIIAQERGEYEEAHRLFGEALGIFERLGDQSGRAMTLLELGSLALLQEKFEQARQIFDEVLQIYDHSDNQRGRAYTLHQLGIVAQVQENYEEARRLFDESLAIKEHLGDQSGRALTLGQLGFLAREQHDYARALSYTMQALKTFINMNSSDRDTALRAIAELRPQVSEEEFITLWQEIIGGIPPTFVTPNEQDLFQRLIDFIQAPTWPESQRLVELQPDLLNSEADTLLAQMITAQPDKNRRATIKQHRALLARCRTVGLDAAFAELYASHFQEALHTNHFQEATGDLVTQFMAVCSQAVAALCIGDHAQRRMVAAQINVVASSEQSLKSASDFLMLLAAWLYDEDTTERATILGSDWHALYEKVVVAVRDKAPLKHNAFEWLESQRRSAESLEQSGDVAQQQGRYDEAQQLYNEALKIFESLGYHIKSAGLLHQLGLLAQWEGAYDKAQQLYSKALQLYRLLGNQDGIAAALHQLGRVLNEQQQYDEAQPFFSEALKIFESLGNQRRCAGATQSLGIIAFEQGQYDKARQLQLEALSLFEQLDDVQGLAYSLYELGLIAWKQRQYDQAQSFFNEALNKYKQLNDQSWYARVLSYLAMIAQEIGHYEKARRLYTKHLIVIEQLGDQHERAKTLASIGLVAHQQRDYVAALNYTVQALDIFERLHSPYYNQALHMIMKMRTELGEEAFAILWRAVIPGQPLPDLPTIDPRQDLLQRLVAFIQASTWAESQRLVETQPDLLSVEADALLIQLAAAQQNEDARERIERHRMLLPAAVRWASTLRLQNCR